MRSSLADFQRRESPRVQQKDSAWFFSELSKVCSVVDDNGKDFKIICPFHNDHNPSLGVDKNIGYFNCFSCGKGGGWNQLAEKLGMKKLGYGKTKEPTDPSNIKDVLSRTLAKSGVKVSRNSGKTAEERPLISPWDDTKDWRGMSGQFLAGVGCIAVDDLKRNVFRIGLPVRQVDGTLLGYTCRAITPKDAKPKYLPVSADNKWREKELPASSALFLLHLVIKNKWKKVVLTEGPVDALNLWSMGIPALSILGVENWTSIKRDIIINLNFEEVFVMMDNDDAGIECQERVIRSLKTSVKTTGLGLPPGKKDPGELSEKQLIWVKNRVLGENT